MVGVILGAYAREPVVSMGLGILGTRGIQPQTMVRGGGGGGEECLMCNNVSN